MYYLIINIRKQKKSFIFNELLAINNIALYIKLHY